MCLPSSSWRTQPHADTLVYRVPTKTEVEIHRGTLFDSSLHGDE